MTIIPSEVSGEEAIVVIGAGLGIAGFLAQTFASQRLEGSETFPLSKVAVPVLVTGVLSVATIELMFGDTFSDLQSGALIKQDKGVI